MSQHKLRFAAHLDQFVSSHQRSSSHETRSRTTPEAGASVPREQLASARVHDDVEIRAFDDADLDGIV